MAMTKERLAEAIAHCGIVESCANRIPHEPDLSDALAQDVRECVAEIEQLRKMLQHAGRELLRHGNPYGAEIGREFPYEEAGSEE